MKLLRKNLVSFNFYVIFSLTDAILPQNTSKKLGALLPMVFSRAMSRSAWMAVELIIFSSALPNTAKSRVMGFVVIRIRKIVLPPQI